MSTLFKLIFSVFIFLFFVFFLTVQNRGRVQSKRSQSFG
jgi:hypothetical protein